MIDLYKIGQWYHHHGLVGETENALLQTIIAVSNKPLGFGIVAPAGSGKTVTIDLLVGDPDSNVPHLINQKYVYFKDAGSEKSFWYDKRINDPDIKIIVFKELQKDGSIDTIEAIKSLTEGKSAKRRVTVAAEDDVKEQYIRPRTVIFSFAVENKNVVFDAELARRCITVATDVSKEQTDEVLKTKSLMRWDLKKIQILTPQEENEIKQYVNSILLMNLKIKNPFAPVFYKYIAEIAPDQKVRSMAEHFWDVVEGITKLHMTNRILVHGDTLLTSVQDLLMAIHIYKKHFVRDIYNIPPLGDIVLQGFKDAEQVEETKKGPSNVTLAKYTDDSNVVYDWYEINHIRKAIKEKQKVVLAQNIVYSICKQLVDAGYLEDWKDGKTTKFKVLDEFKFFRDPDINELIDGAYKFVKEKYPDIAQKWLQKNYESYIHPITGEIIEIKK